MAAVQIIDLVKIVPVFGDPGVKVVRGVRPEDVLDTLNPTDRFEPEQRVKVALRLAKAHLFDGRAERFIK